MLWDSPPSRLRVNRVSARTGTLKFARMPTLATNKTARVGQPAVRRDKGWPTRHSPSWQWPRRETSYCREKLPNKSGPEESGAARKKKRGDGLESELERKLQDARVTNSGDMAERGGCR